MWKSPEFCEKDTKNSAAARCHYAALKHAIDDNYFISLPAVVVN